MSGTITKFQAGSGRGRTWLWWGMSLLLVLAAHCGGLLLLRRSVPGVGPASPESILLDLAPEPTAPPEPSPTPPAAPAPAAPEVPKPEPSPQPPEPDPVPPQPPEPPSAESAPPEPAPPDPPPTTPSPIDVAPAPVPDAILAVPPAQRPPPPRPRVQPKRPPPPNVRPTSQNSPETTQLPQVAQPGPAASAPSGEVQATWEARLLAHLARFKRFPASAQRRGEQGTALMRLTVNRNGSVLSTSLTRTSGYADLDEEARSWIARADPVPAFPPEITGTQMEIMVPLRFSLR